MGNTDNDEGREERRPPIPRHSQTRIPGASPLGILFPTDERQVFLADDGGVYTRRNANYRWERVEGVPAEVADAIRTCTQQMLMLQARMHERIQQLERDVERRADG